MEGKEHFFPGFGADDLFLFALPAAYFFFGVLLCLSLLGTSQIRNTQSYGNKKELSPSLSSSRDIKQGQKTSERENAGELANEYTPRHKVYFQNAFSYLFPMLSSMYKENSSVVELGQPEPTLGKEGVEVELDLKNGVGNENLVKLFLEIVLLLALFVALGHLLSGLSNIFMDRAFQRNCFGYPFERLFKLDEVKKWDWKEFRKEPKNPDNNVSEQRRIRWVLSPIFTFAYLGLLVFVALFIWHIKNEWRYLGISAAVFYWAIFSVKQYYTCFTKSKEMSRRNWNRGWYVFKYYLCNCGMRITWILQNIFSFLISIFSKIIIEEIFPITSDFEKSFQDEFRERFSKTFGGTEFESSDTNSFWLPYHFICEKDTQAKLKIARYERFYLFARNMSFASLLLTYISFYEIVRHNDGFNLMIYFFSLALIATIFFFARYYFIMYNYFTKSVLRTFFILTDPSATVKKV